MDTVAAHGRLTAALAIIEHAWQLTYDPARTQTLRGPKTSRTAAQSKAPVNVDVLDVRAEAAASLAGWVQLVIEDLGKLPDEPIGAGDGPALAAFLAVHVGPLAAHEAGPVAALELDEHAKKLDRLANPDEPGRLFIGRCPLSREGGLTCDAPLYWATETQDATCRRCGASGGWQDWLEWMGEQLDSTLTVTQLVTYLARRTGRAFTHGQVRNWAYRGLIQPVGKDGRGRWLYDATAVLVFAQRQQIAA